MKKILSNITYTIFVLLVLGLVFLLMAPPLPGLGNVEVKIVKSGSMEPTIMTGAVVAIYETKSYTTGDVITFAEKGSKIPTTHRIIGVEKVDGKNHFITKGDANEDRDANTVSPKDIIGKVIFDIPYLGFVLDFARQPLGFGLLVGIPALIIVLDELTNIWLEVRRIRKVGFDKDMIAPLVVTPYSPTQIKDENEPANDFGKNHLPATSSSTKQMDIKPMQRRAKISTQSQPATDTYRFSHDIRPKMGTVVAGFIILVFSWGQITGGVTLAYPSDIETAFDNGFNATAVDFSMSSDKTIFSIESDEVVGTSSALVSLSLSNMSNNDLVYDVEVKNGASALCDVIVLEAEAPFSHNDHFSNLSKTNLSLSDDFALNFSLSESYDGFDSCNFDLIFTAYLADGGMESAYFDVETIALEFISINEISPNTSSFTTLSTNNSVTNDLSSTSPTNDTLNEEVEIENESGESALVSQELEEPNKTDDEESVDNTEVEVEEETTEEELGEDSMEQKEKDGTVEVESEIEAEKTEENKNDSLPENPEQTAKEEPVKEEKNVDSEEERKADNEEGEREVKDNEEETDSTEAVEL